MKLQHLRLESFTQIRYSCNPCVNYWKLEVVDVHRALLDTQSLAENAPVHIAPIAQTALAS